METRTKEVIHPYVSILMLTYNRAGFIGLAIESILAQTSTDWECIIVDDGSTDNTATIVASYNDPRIRYIQHVENAGVIARRNEAVREAHGLYLAVLDSDDQWIDPSKLEKQIAFLDHNPDYVLVGTQANLISGEVCKKTHLPTSDRDIRQSILSKNPFINSSSLFRKSAVPEDPYRSEDYLVEDYALWFRLGVVGKFTNIPDVTTNYYENPTGQNKRNVLEATRKSFSLIHEYRNLYPNYWYALLLWQIKIFLRKILLFR